jgi:hypothetical protein
MSNLKEKFGKFELSKEQAKMVKGGAIYCSSRSKHSSGGYVFEGNYSNYAIALQQFQASGFACCGYRLSCSNGLGQAF